MPAPSEGGSPVGRSARRRSPQSRRRPTDLERIVCGSAPAAFRRGPNQRKFSANGQRTRRPLNFCRTIVDDPSAAIKYARNPGGCGNHRNGPQASSLGLSYQTGILGALAATAALCWRECELDDPLLGKTVQMGVPIRLSATPGEIAGPAPALDSLESARPLIEEAERRAAMVADQPRALAPPSPSSGPLAGTRVLDFTGYIAGGYSTMLLAHMGADVIKVESLAGDGFRFAAFAFQGWNQNKRGVALDLRHPQGREIAYEIAKQADLVMENFRPGSRELGVDY